MSRGLRERLQRRTAAGLHGDRPAEQLVDRELVGLAAERPRRRLVLEPPVCVDLLVREAVALLRDSKRRTVSVGTKRTGRLRSFGTRFGVVRRTSVPRSVRTSTHVARPTRPWLCSICVTPSSSGMRPANTASVLHRGTVPGSILARSASGICARKLVFLPRHVGHFIPGERSGSPPRRLAPTVSTPPGTSRAPGSASAAIRSAREPERRRAGGEIVTRRRRRERRGERGHGQESTQHVDRDLRGSTARRGLADGPIVKNTGNAVFFTRECGFRQLAAGRLGIEHAAQRREEKWLGLAVKPPDAR